MAKDKTATAEPKTPGKMRQIRNAYTLTRRTDKRIGLVLFAVFVGTFAAVLALGFLLDVPVIFGITAFFTALLAVTIVFGRRAERAAFSQIEGQLGAAASALQTLRRGWVVTPGVAANRDMALVHRAVGRPGIVLVGEGPPARVASLLLQEKRKYSRIVPDVPIHDVQAGSEEGQIPLRKLTRHVMKLPRAIRPAEVSTVEKRLKSMAMTSLPIPKGPMPKGAKMPRPPRPRSR